MISYIVNFLTFFRVLLGIVIFILIASSNSYFLALILFLIAGMTDYFDGYLARKYEAVSELGEILDPIADKILIVFIFFALSVNLSSYLIAVLASVIISREIFVSALRDFCSRKGIENATKVTFLAKIKTSVQLFTISIYLLGLSINYMLLIVLADLFLVIAVLITIYTGYIYTINTKTRLK